MRVHIQQTKRPRSTSDRKARYYTSPSPGGESGSTPQQPEGARSPNRENPLTLHAPHGLPQHRAQHRSLHPITHHRPHAARPRHARRPRGWMRAKIIQKDDLSTMILLLDDLSSKSTGHGPSGLNSTPEPPPTSQAAKNTTAFAFICYMYVSICIKNNYTSTGVS